MKPFGSTAWVTPRCQIGIICIKAAPTTPLARRPQRAWPRSVNLTAGRTGHETIRVHSLGYAALPNWHYLHKGGAYDAAGPASAEGLAFVSGRHARPRGSLSPDCPQIMLTRATPP